MNLIEHNKARYALLNPQQNKIKTNDKNNLAMNYSTTNTVLLYERFDLINTQCALFKTQLSAKCNELISTAIYIIL